MESNEETFSRKIFHDIEILIRDRDQTINYTKLFAALNKEYKFSKFVTNNLNIWKFIQSYIDTDDINLLIVNDNEFNFKDNDVMKIDHSITTLERIGLMNNLQNGYSIETRGTYGSQEFLAIVIISADISFIRYINQINMLISQADASKSIDKPLQTDASKPIDKQSQAYASKPIDKPLQTDASKPIKSVTPFDVTKIRFSIDEDLANEIREDVKVTLDQVKSYKLVDMINYINTKYGYRLHKLLNEQTFRHLCSNLYMKDHQDSIPKDEEGNKILIKVIDYDIEKQWIEETIGYGEYPRDEFIKLHNDHFNTTYNERTYTLRFGVLFEKDGTNSRRYKQRKVEGKTITFFSLANLPDRDDVFKKYINETNPTMEQFNQHFHRYETLTSFGMIMTKIRYPEFKEFFKDHGTSDEDRRLFNRTFNKRCDMKAFINIYNDLSLGP